MGIPCICLPVQGSVESFECDQPISDSICMYVNGYKIHNQIDKQVNEYVYVCMYVCMYMYSPAETSPDWSSASDKNMYIPMSTRKTFKNLPSP